MTSAVPATAVDLWAVGPPPLTPADHGRLLTLLTPEEAARGARFVRARDRESFAVTRALVRTVLSRYGPTAPRDWRFVTNAHDCPFVVDAQAGEPPLRFNVSHTEGLIVLAVARGHRIGVDVEAVDREVLDELPERHFAPDEVRDLRALPPGDQPRVFFDYWTLKEAYIKARGLGLALPLDQFAFQLGEGAAPAIRFAPGFVDDARRWQFWQAWPTPRHRLALAIERDGPDLPVTLRHLDVAALLP
jgi:4'-phosphopantetheinyl transferase